jgi:hypothetical protein
MTGANLLIAALVLGFLLAAPASPASNGIERDASTADNLNARLVNQEVRMQAASDRRSG